MKFTKDFDGRHKITQTHLSMSTALKEATFIGRSITELQADAVLLHLKLKKLCYGVKTDRCYTVLHTISSEVWYASKELPVKFCEVAVGSFYVTNAMHIHTFISD